MRKILVLNKYSAYNIILLLFFFADGVFEISLPIYLFSLNYSFGKIGAMVASLSMGIVAFKFFVSMHSDRAGRKFYVVVSLMGSAATCLVFSLGNSIWYIISVLILRGAFRGAFLAVRSPLIKDICPESERGRYLGLASAFSTVGSALGGVIAGFLYFEEYVWILFFVIGCIYLFAGLFSIVYLPSKEVVMENPDDHNDTGFKLGIISRIRTAPRALKILCGVNFIQNIITPPLWSMILPVYFTSFIGMSIKSMGLVFTMDNLLGVPSSIIGGVWADKKNFKKKCVFLNFLCAMIAIVLVMPLPSFFFILAILSFMTIFSVNSPILEKIESISARNNETGFDLGLISASVAMGSSLGSIIFGVLLDTYGFKSAYLVISGGYILICLLLWNIKLTNS